MTDVSIAIVTYHSALVLDALTQDLRAQRDVSYEVLFTDNGSTDGTVETLANLWPGRTQTNSSNLGYTAAQRQNLARAAGRYVLFLNPDTRFDATLDVDQHIRVHEFHGLDFQPAVRRWAASRRRREWASGSVMSVR